MGIGEATARALTERGGRVALLARSTDALKTLSDELPGSYPIPADVTDFSALRQAIDQARDHFGRIDGLVNNAGRGYGSAVENINPEIFEQIFRLNVLAPIVAMQCVIPHMREQQEGSIVNVNSGTAFMTVPAYSVYSASKRALMGVSLTARAELQDDGIAVSEVYPGVTATNFGKNRMVNVAGEGPAGNYADGDTPEHVATLILQAIEEGGAQYFANDYIRNLANGSPQR